jgi:hypothetical protein
MTGLGLTIRRMLPSLIWCVLVLAGLAILVFGQNRSAGPVAKRFLPMNALLLAHDLVPDEFAGRYVVAPNGIPAGATLRPQDVALQPALPTGLPVGTYFSIPVASVDIANGVNAGASAPLCGKDGAVFAMVQVLVVRCDPDGPGVSCSALIQVPDKIAAELAAKGIKTLSAAKDLSLSLRCKP